MSRLRPIRLPAHFALQSSFHKRDVLTPRLRLQRRTLCLYLGLVACGATLASASGSPALSALGLGLVMPGAGGVAQVSDLPGLLDALPSVAVGLGLFVACLALWFATGNALAPPMVWVALAVWSASQAEHIGAPLALTGLPATAALVAMAGYLLTRPRPHRSAATWRPDAIPREPTPPELSRDDLRRMTLLLDRAMQPVEAFDGFDRRDQFQTAALRYQVNFVSYALSVVQAEHMPAFDGYMQQAQDRLAQKQLDPRMWGYWRLENLWGNLSADPDPIARDNIMFSGFLAAQLAFAGNASGQTMFGLPGVLEFRRHNRVFAYGLPGIVAHLADRMARAPMGLLACEPNWVYPLCNTITASGIRATDAMFRTDFWSPIAPGFSRAMTHDFTRPNGDLVPFVSSLTGIAAPAVGGAVMQAFPCLFLNTVLPEHAARQWGHALKRLGPDPRRALWPVDVGNYGFTRASSYAASAAAAREMGDDLMAERLLGLLEEDCPATLHQGALHRNNASLWAHALELIARTGRRDALRNLATSPKMAKIRLTSVSEDTLVGQAMPTPDGLRLVLWPRAGATLATVRIDGALPGATCHLRGIGSWTADGSGGIEPRVPLSGRTEVILQVEGA